MMPSKGQAPRGPSVPLIVAFLGGGQQGMQHLDGRLEHLDELEQPLGRAVEAAGEAIGVRVVLGVVLELADVDLADQRRDVLVVLVAGLGLGDGDLAQLRGHEAGDGELGDVAAVLVEALGGPGRDQAREAPPRHAVLVLQQVGHALRVEQAEGRFEDRAHLAAGLQHVDRLVLHEQLEALGEGRLAAADRAEEIEDLLALFEALGGIAKIADDALDGVFHAEEVVEGRIDLDGPVEEDAPQALVLGGVDQIRLADRRDHALGRRRVHRRIFSAGEEVVLQAHLLLLFAFVELREDVEDFGGLCVHGRLSCALGRTRIKCE